MQGTHFFGHRIQYLLNKIQTHQEHLLNACTAYPSGILKILHDDTFWQQLYTLADKDKIREIPDIWEKIKPLAHLNSKQLLSLLEEEVIPLERHLGEAQMVLEKEKSEVEANPLWPPHWFYPASDPTLLIYLKESQARLLAFKTKLTQGLLYRCQAHSHLNAPRQVDDIVAALATQINALGVSPNLQIPQSHVTPLTDERRVMIYDHLEKAWDDKDELHKIVLSPIPARGQDTPRSRADIEKDLAEFREFHHKILNAMHKCALDSKMPDLAPWMIKLWHYRYFFYFAVTGIAYRTIIQLVQPLLTVMLGLTVFAAVDWVLFYGLALAPMWFLGWRILQSLKESVRDYFAKGKRMKIYDTLDVLCAAQEFISNHLDQPIIDLNHFDSVFMAEKINNTSSVLEKCKTDLSAFSITEDLFCENYIRECIGTLKVKINSQQKQLTIRANTIASLIASTINHPMEILEKSISEPTLSPAMKPSQVSGLKNFVTAFGNKRIRQQFELNANPLYRWLSNIERAAFEIKSQVFSFQQPYGRHGIREDYLKGWEWVFRKYLQKGNTRNAALQLNNLMMGKRSANLAQILVWIQDLKIGDQSMILLQKIQTHLFKTLTRERIANAQLLSEHHKSLLAQWVRTHEKAIKDAEKEMQNLLDPQRDVGIDEVLEFEALCSNSQELLDGMEIYNHAFGIKSKTSYPDSIKNYFEKYQGEKAIAFHLLKFIPEEERLPHLIAIAKKRLHWILGHLGDGIDPEDPFTDTDTFLFHNPRLDLARDKFDLTALIEKSERFNSVFDPKVATFLDACRYNGLDSGNLLTHYQNKNNKGVRPC